MSIQGKSGQVPWRHLCLGDCRQGKQELSVHARVLLLTATPSWSPEVVDAQGAMVSPVPVDARNARSTEEDYTS
jgi:hypothetical protein